MAAAVVVAVADAVADAVACSCPRSLSLVSRSTSNMPQTGGGCRRSPAGCVKLICCGPQILLPQSSCRMQNALCLSVCLSVRPTNETASITSLDSGSSTTDNLSSVAPSSRHRLARLQRPISVCPALPCHVQAEHDTIFLVSPLSLWSSVRGRCRSLTRQPRCPAGGTGPIRRHCPLVPAPRRRRLCKCDVLQRFQPSQCMWPCPDSPPPQGHDSWWSGQPGRRLTGSAASLLVLAASTSPLPRKFFFLLLAHAPSIMLCFFSPAASNSDVPG